MKQCLGLCLCTGMFFAATSCQNAAFKKDADIDWQVVAGANHIVIGRLHEASKDISEAYTPLRIVEIEIKRVLKGPGVNARFANLVTSSSSRAEKNETLRRTFSGRDVILFLQEYNHPYFGRTGVKNTDAHRQEFVIAYSEKMDGVLPVSQQAIDEIAAMMKLHEEMLTDMDTSVQSEALLPRPEIAEIVNALTDPDLVGYAVNLLFSFGQHIVPDLILLMDDKREAPEGLITVILPGRSDGRGKGEISNFKFLRVSDILDVIVNYHTDINMMVGADMLAMTEHAVAQRAKAWRIYLQHVGCARFRKSSEEPLRTWVDSHDAGEFAFVEKQRDHGPKKGLGWTSPSTGMEFVWVEALQMWVGKFEVTNSEYRKMNAGHNSGEFDRYSLDGDRQPVVMVDYADVIAFAKWLNDQDKQYLGGLKYRLPSEQEWMTYAQCGDGRKYPWGDKWPPISGQAGNYFGEEHARYGPVIKGYNDGFIVTAPVDQLWANPWGLHGVGGNVWEACALDGTWKPDAWRSVWRGASWRQGLPEYSVRCTSRHYPLSQMRFDTHGFRLVLSSRNIRNPFSLGASQ